MLMACWSAAQQHEGILLLGRTGRLSKGSGWLSRASGCVSLESCDVAAQADSNAAIRRQRCSHAAALHAGDDQC